MSSDSILDRKRNATIFYWVDNYIQIFLPQTYDSDHEDENEGKEGKEGSSLLKGKEEGKPRKEIDWDQNGTNGGGSNYQKGDKKDFKKDKSKHKDGKDADGDSTRQWRNFNSDSKGNERDSGNSQSHSSEKQSAIRPRVENNRAARRAGAGK